jgi:DNA modification methylase
VPALKNFFEVVFSSVILHQTKKNKNAIKLFLGKGIQAMASLEEFRAASGHAAVVWGDSRRLPFGDDTIDLMITSPPSGKQINDMRIREYSLSWLGMGRDRLDRFQDFYIGSQTVRPGTHLLQRDTTHPDSKTACILGQYFEDLAQVLCEMQRVLKPGRAAIVVVGPLVVDRMVLQVHEIIGGLAEAVGFQRVGTKAIGARHTPGSLNGNKKRVFKCREYVVGLVKGRMKGF